jgi:tetratricopeptide (TPR) repeat protein
MLSRVIALALILAATFAWCPPVQAQVDRKSEAKAKDHYKKGMRLYDLGRFDEAVQEFETAYQYKEDPFYIYNLAQAHRRAGHPEKALELYRTYLRKAPAAADREDVERRIAALEKSLAPAPSAVTPPPAPVLHPVEPARTARVEPQDEPRPPARPRAEDNPEAAHHTSPLLLAGGLTAAAGLVVAAVGIGFGVNAKNKFDEVKNLPAYDPALEDSAKQMRTLEYVFVGVGAAAFATGTTMFVLGLSGSSDERRVALVPRMDRNSLGLALAGRFR